MEKPYVKYSEEDLIKFTHQSLKYIGRQTGKGHIVQCNTCQRKCVRTVANLYRPCKVCTGKNGLTLEHKIARCHPQIEYVKHLDGSTHLVRCKDCKYEMHRTTNHFKNQCPKCRSNWKSMAIPKKDIESRLNSGLEYVGRDASGQILVRCKECGINKSRKTNQLPSGCECNTICYESKAEKEIKEWIQSLGLQTQKLKIQRREFDIKIESHKLLIEYNGLYWHSESVISNKHKSISPHMYHRGKLELANSLGYRLITIFEDEWLNRKDQVKNFLKSTLNIHNTKLFARNLEVREISRSIAGEFLDAHHIQGKARTTIISFGLYNHDELVGVITGGRHPRNIQAGLVLDRLCFKDGVQIVGGAGKLFKKLQIWAKENSYRKILSWSDNRWSEGGVYTALGFTLEAEIKPDFSYIDGRIGRRYSKQSLQKSNIKTKYPQVYDRTKTERQMTLEIGFDRIWDCGKKRWVKEI